MPSGAKAFISVRDADKVKVLNIARALHKIGFSLLATRGTAAALSNAGIAVAIVNKVTEGRPHIVDMIKNRHISIIVNTVEDKRARQDSYAIRQAALQHKITYYTTLAGARAACLGMQHIQEIQVYDLQGLHQQIKSGASKQPLSAKR